MVAEPSGEERIDVLTLDESWALLDEHARRYLNLTAREFVDAWAAGTIQDPDRPEVMRVALLLPLVR